MCQKQCRDQNGFKCHLTSESHQRQLLLFAENQGSYLRQFSREFEGNFMHVRSFINLHLLLFYIHCRYSNTPLVANERVPMLYIKNILKIRDIFT